MALKFTTTVEAGKLNGVKAIIYGKAGAGKTVACSTAPEPIIFSAEAGLLSLARKNIAVAEINTLSDLMDAYQWATESEESKKFDTFELDSITEIGEKVLVEAKETNTKDPRNAYGELIEKMLVVIKSFRDINNKNIVFTAKETRIKDDMTGRVYFSPSMPGQVLGQALPYYFDLVLRIDIEQAPDPEIGEYRYFLTRSNATCDAKDRSGMLLPMEKPDLTYIFNKIKKGLK